MVVSAPLLVELSQGREQQAVRGQWDGHWVTVEALRAEVYGKIQWTLRTRAGDKCPGGWQVGQGGEPRAPNIVPADREG